MTKLIDPSLITEGDMLTEQEGGAKVKVFQATETDIAWFKTAPEGGEFGECSRTMVSRVFKNIAPCKSSTPC